MSAGAAPAVRGGGPRPSVHRTGTLRTGTVRGGAGRTASPRAVSQRSTGSRTTPSRTSPSRSVPVRPELRLVTPGDPARARRSRTRSRAPFVLLILALLVGTTLSLLVLNTAIAVDSLKATSLRQENARRAQEVQRLQRQVIDGSTPEELAAEATRAGLVPAGTAGYLVVEPDGTSTFRGTPVPAPAPGPPPGQPDTGQPDTTGGN